MRSSEIVRQTAETNIRLTLLLDGTGESNIQTGVGFLDHMLTLFARHGAFDLSVHCEGDTGVDDHHTVEDIGICLGMAFSEALGDLRGVNRFGSMLLPMDEALILAAVDCSGRGGYYGTLGIPMAKVGSFDTELVDEFLMAFSRKANLTLHVKKLEGTNSHHIIEGCFKALARALREAVAADVRNRDAIPSTKGVL